MLQRSKLTIFKIWKNTIWLSVCTWRQPLYTSKLMMVLVIHRICFLSTTDILSKGKVMMFCRYFEIAKYVFPCFLYLAVQSQAEDYRPLIMIHSAIRTRRRFKLTNSKFFKLTVKFRVVSLAKFSTIESTMISWIEKFLNSETSLGYVTELRVRKFWRHEKWKENNIGKIGNLLNLNSRKDLHNLRPFKRRNS